MALEDLTDPAAVTAALDEYDALGGEAFLRKYGFGRSRSYFIERNGKLYDSKAVAGVAVGKQHPDRGALRPADFSGGEDTVARTLRDLGFTVISTNAEGSFGSAEALELIRASWGPETPSGKYLAVWRTPQGRDLALQLEQASARIWLEARPPFEGLSVTRYGPDEDRHSYLRGNAARLAQPNEAWLTVVGTARHLEELLAWYRALPERDGEVETPTYQFAELMRAFLQRFAEVRTGPFETVPDLWSTMDDLKRFITAMPSVTERPDLIVEWSLGRGVWASVPWIAVMDRRITTSTQQGIYVVFLISRDMATVHLTLIQGTTSVVNENGQAAAREILRGRSEGYRALIPELAEHGFHLSGGLELGAEGWRAISYEVSAIAYRSLPVDGLPTDQTLDQMMRALLEAYARLSVASPMEPTSVEAPPTPTFPGDEGFYGIDEAMRGLFIDRAEFERILQIWRPKKNLVLQGAPGVGKSFIARRLAYALMGKRDPSRVEVVQFHQSYGYEDFVQGYRPTVTGGFELRDGVFFKFCERARADPSGAYVFIIDEINRGNLSKVFGELMLLIEHDKRSADWAAQLAYAQEGAPPFYVPPNVFLLGMMNTADRSLSLVDYALRRRFSFVPLRPCFTNPAFATYLQARGVPARTLRAIIDGMTELNAAIGEDTANLGPGFQIGHSFFTPSEDGPVGTQWYEAVVKTEIRPLLEEYWFDDPAKATDWCDRLLARA